MNWVYFLMALPLMIMIFLSHLSFPINEPSFEINRTISNTRILENNKAEVTINLHNNSKRIPFLEIFDKLSDRIEIEQGSNYMITSVKKNEDITMKYTVNCPVRGYYKIGPLNIRTKDVFGFFYKEKTIGETKRLSVIPLIEEIRNINSKTRTGIYPGLAQAKHAGLGTEFYGIREYTTSDTFKKINWKAFARWNKAMVNEFELESITSITIIVDAREIQAIGSIKKNPLEYNVKAAATIASHFLKKRDQVGLIIYGKSDGKIKWIYPESGKKQLDKLINALIETKPDGYFTLGAVINQAIMHMIPKKGLIILLSSLEDDPTILGAIETLKARGYKVIIITPSPNDIEYTMGDFDTYHELAYKILTLRRKNLLSKIRNTDAVVVDWNTVLPIALTLKEVEQCQIHR